MTLARRLFVLTILSLIACGVAAQPEWGDEAELRGITKIYLDAGNHRLQKELIDAILEELPEPAPMQFVGRDAAEVHLDIIPIHPEGAPAFSQIMVFRLVNERKTYRLLWASGADRDHGSHVALELQRDADLPLSDANTRARSTFS